ncbi:MAG: TlpA family protein disulfide reductase, partial [bacterium]|nr:TlpA family protein disulfide reductase [bacterium]
ASGAFEISGSLATAQKDEADSIVRRFTQKIKSLQQEAIIAKSTRDDQLWLSVNERMRIAETKKDIELKKLVWENAPSVSAVYILNYINFEKEFAFVDSVATKFQEKLPESPYTIALASKMEQAKEIMRLKELEVKVGDIAPEIELPDANGNMVSLTSLRGKYVLIDFWASWCRPCRAENPNVKKVYATYADKGFEILGVSLDVNSNKWKQAIEVDGLPWEHVLDTRSAESASATYNVQTIPATFLVDPEGKIIAKGLRGISLRTKLQEIFG